MGPMESKVTKNAPLKLLNKLYKKGISSRFTGEECVNIILATF